MSESLQFALDALPTLLIGAITTLQLTASAVILGLIGGTLLGMARLSSFKPLQIASRVYIDFFRGTPLLVQIFMIYFGIPAATGISFNRFLAAILALSLNASAYLAEIVRGGIQSIETGQREASESLGLSPVQTMRYVIFPQAFRRMIPPLGNEFITLLKDTSLVAVIGYEEILRRGQLIVATNYRAFEIYFTVALVYLVLNILSAQAFIWLEKWMDPTNKSKRHEATVVPEPTQSA
ncbi:amino acid ABC transporter permease [Leptolyngbya iicbica]|uniref:Amino acid ABC transporter permease n=2 Tax=Cyanophyceae TaxID=3028117 RepID=A0A4Q7EG84_9CYAN|nr:amino acid ABC transporter permease [Leptolyngbya sp. LK]RZM82056.1 amino acid ABC transporter permease [Leptolyngbya sp. LK]